MQQATVRLYDEDAYLNEFEARVLSCEETAGGFAVVLDRTAFFPEAGGQTPDRGEITDGAGANVRVLDVQIDETAGVITHVTHGALAPGSTVTGRIDAAHRFDNMQQHTGEHIFSGLICAAHGCNNVGFHLSDQTVTMDYDCAVSAEEIAEIEARANEVIWRDLPVICAFPSDEELAGLDYRSKKELSGRIRIVTIPDVDVCACCAPHVRRTGEVGLLKVLALQNYKGGIRVTIACGGRALRELSENRRILTEMAREMSTAPEEVPAHVAKLKEELSAAKGRASALAGSLLMMRLEAEDPSGSAGLLTVFDGATDPGSARHALDAWMDSHAGLCAIFTGSDADGWNYLAGAGRLGEADAREVAQTLKAAFGAKGGGSREMVQGRVQSAEAEIRRALQKEGI